MKKLGVALLAVAFSVPIFARSQAPASGTAAQTQTQKGKKTTKHSKSRRHNKKGSTSMAKPAQSTPTK